MAVACDDHVCMIFHLGHDRFGDREFEQALRGQLQSQAGIAAEDQGRNVDVAIEDNPSHLERRFLRTGPS
jgi:hypothetical protein